jgi:hypothetical protein
MSKSNVISTDMAPDYCSCCYDAARKAGRPVRQTDVYKWQICDLCESRIREGLLHYFPSNGTEFGIFESHCNRCRHYNPDADYGNHEDKACTWGILDKILNAQIEDYDTINAWFDPAHITREAKDGSLICPADCLKFTHKNDGDGPLRDPPPKDAAGQMELGECFTVEEIVPIRAKGKVLV